LKKNLNLFFLLIWLCTFSGFAQTTISGTVFDEKNQALSGATITISRDSISSILAYAISKSDGSFQIKLNTQEEKVILKASYIGLQTVTRTLQNKTQNIAIQLLPSSEELKEVVVKSELIQRRGDTLSFSVEAFKDKNDRVIADVLRKMPGIEIKPGGQIHYQGKPIQKYYIEGLDLLEGRYSLANENLAADAVSKVEILENHQPIRVLDSLEFSERASLNIKLKNDVTLSGTAKLGLGAAPLLWETNLTPMLFTKKRQVIASYQSNNTGKNVSSQISDFSLNLAGNTYDIEKNDWLSILNPATPPFSQQRWLDNNVHLASANAIQRLKNDLDLKVNASYLNDYQQQVGSVNTQIFTPTDTITILEKTQNRIFTKTLQGKLTLEQNAKKNYLKNQLEFNGFWDSKIGNLHREKAKINQNLSNLFSGFKNQLTILKTFGKQLITFNSNTGYTHSNQDLYVVPGQFEELLNDGDAYSKTQQTLQSQKWFTDNSAGMTKALGNFTSTSKLGFAFQEETLNSDIYLEENPKPLGKDFKNRTRFYSNEIYLDHKLSYKNKNETWSLRLNTPLAYKNFKLKGENSQNLNAFVFEPNLYLRRKLSAYWEASISGSLNYNFGKIQRLHAGYLLTNYRNIQRYNTPISESVVQNYSASLNYRNPVKRLFIKGSYSLGHTTNNLLYSNQIAANGATILEAILRDNTMHTQRYNLEASKYISNINTSAKVTTSYTQTQKDQLLNDQLTATKNESYNLHTSLESEILKWLSLLYNSTYSLFKSSLEVTTLQQINTQQHNADLYLYPWENQYVSIGGEYYKNSLSNSDNNYFLNLSYQYTFTKKKIDLNLMWSNILNTKNFINASSSEYFITQNSYILRPSQVLASISFSF